MNTEYLSGRKRCVRCKEVRDLAMFSYCGRSANKLSYECRVCHRERHVIYYTRNKEKIREMAKTPEYRAKQKAYADKPESRRVNYNRHLKRKFGITIDKYELMFCRQNGACAICGKQNLDGKRLCVDHCHSTGRVRGLLCDVCNTTIGKIGESLDTINSMYDYIAYHRRMIGAAIEK